MREELHFRLPTSRFLDSFRVADTPSALPRPEEAGTTRLQNAVPAIEMIGNGIQVGLLGNRMMKCRVEYGYLRNGLPKSSRAARMPLMLLGL